MKNNPLTEYPANIRIQLLRDRAIPRFTVNNPAQVEQLLGEYLRSLDRESVFAVYLNTSNEVLGIEEVTRGTLTASLLNPCDLVKSALLLSAASLIVVHNHPSGNNQPSAEDQDVTLRIKSACKLFGISLLDHLIIGDGIFSILNN